MRDCGLRGRAELRRRTEGWAKGGAALQEAAWGPGGMRDQEWIQVYLGGQEVEGGSSEGAL